ncbi:hypothetical protein HW509_07760 [Asaia spathodeae]|uniref:hypothetical protein n=1 Tax=Asaia spathodeae TaxID=657016 RepID=UPI002FC2EF59
MSGLRSTRARSGFTFFLKLRARYLLHAAKASLMQRWMILVGAILASPSIPFVAIFLQLGHLSMAVLAGPQGFRAHLIAVFAAQTGFVAWSQGLRRFVRGGNFRPFLDTLPITPQTRLLTAGALLAALDLPLFLSFVICGILTGAASLSALCLYCMALMVFAGLVLLLQAALVERLIPLCIAIFVADFLLAGGCVTQPVWSRVLYFFGAAGFALAGREPGIGALSAWLSAHRRPPRHVRARPVDRLARLSPVLRVQLRSWLEPGSGVGVLLVIALLLPIGLWVLLSVFAYDGRSIPVMIIGMAVVSQCSLAPFVALDTAHRRGKAFIATLPLSRSFWIRRDLALVLTVFAPSAFVFVLPLCLHALVSPVALIVIVVSYGLLLVVMRSSLRIDTRWRPMASVALSILWVSFILMEVTA